MSLNVTFNKIIMTLIGFSLIAAGILAGVMRHYAVGAGMLFFGIGSLFWSSTNGFIDMSPRGQVFYKIGIFSFLIGIGITIFYLSGYYPFR